MKILIISKTPTHPTNEGNRWGILSQAEILHSLGNEVHFCIFMKKGCKSNISKQVWKV